MPVSPGGRAKKGVLAKVDNETPNHKKEDKHSSDTIVGFGPRRRGLSNSNRPVDPNQIRAVPRDKSVLDQATKPISIRPPRDPSPPKTGMAKHVGVLKRKVEVIQNKIGHWKDDVVAWCNKGIDFGQSIYRPTPKKPDEVVSRTWYGMENDVRRFRGRGEVVNAPA